ncbi:DUF559 domain-containing protein [Adlercreutzia sp. R7]|uniref:DUF559 domain-containing protein n=1 Tax=Adlercreutzia wanghongyangiae TaxID=3111451 RepID=A0ABU6IG81_9ACTN|nr:DUF559 domain-containing protein [Adlercreutzia sp. R7]
MSKIALFGPTALELFGHTVHAPLQRRAITSERAAEFTPSKRVLDHVHSTFPFLSRPAHITVFDRKHRRQKYARCHLGTPALLNFDFLHVGDGILAPPPEVALVQAMRGRSVIQAAAQGSALCASYSLHADSPTIIQREPIATRASLEMVTRSCSSIPGCKTVRNALPWILPHAASPREIALGLVLFLPVRLGGYGLPRPTLNFPIPTGKHPGNLADRRYYVADLCWPHAHLIVEYDSDAFHLTSDQHYHDIVKRTTLESMGYHVITVSRRQLNDPSEMDKVAACIAKALQKEWRFRVRDFPTRQTQLWTILGLAPNR